MRPSSLYTDMDRSLYQVAATFILLGGLAVPQSHGECPEHPATLSAMRDCYRVLLISATEAPDSKLTEQVRLLGSDAAGLRERDLLIVPLHAAAAAIAAVEPLPVARLSAPEADKAQEHFRIHEGFTIVLVGKDGGEKLRSHEPLTLDRLFGKIDSMPMRKNEMRERR